MADRVDHRLSPVAEARLTEDVVGVGLDGSLRDVEALGDLAVVEPLRDEPEHLGLARCEVVGEIGLASRLRDAPYHRPDNAELHRGVEESLAGMDGADGSLDFLRARPFGELAEGARLERAEDGRVVGVGGQHHDARLRIVPGDAPRRLDAVAAQHAQVH